MILVINETTAAPEQVSVNNRILAQKAGAQSETLWQSPPELQGFKLSLLQDRTAPRDILLVDRFSEGRKLPARGGVGHARKSGADLAANLIHRKRILSPWIHCTDADVRLPETYFSCCNALPDPDPSQHPGSDYAALVYPYHHCDIGGTAAAGDVLLATALYELSLRYYVAGLKFAGSPYAFNTIGSTMAVRASDYAKVRGFPKREAGEDFYLLNKLAKVGPVLELDQSPDCEAVQIAARRSDRVPFGTGAAVNTITGLADPEQQFLYYNPAVFELLQEWLQSWPAIWHARSTDLAGCRPELLSGLKKMRIAGALDHAFRQSKDLDQFTRQMHTWFDAFRTLKLIHILRDDGLPSVSFSQLQAHQIYGQLFSDPLPVIHLL